MICVVPMAGPSAFAEDGLPRQLERIEGLPLFHYLLSRRTWRNEIAASDYIFILRSSAELELYQAAIEKYYPESASVILGKPTIGALMSVLAGLALVRDENQPLCIDLVDIDFKLRESPTDEFESNVVIGGILPLFESREPKFSYAKLVGEFVTETAEKNVISSFASAGVYFFRSAEHLLVAAADSLRRKPELQFKGALFVCPAMNGLLRFGHKVKGLSATAIRCF